MAGDGGAPAVVGVSRGWRLTRFARYLADDPRLPIVALMIIVALSFGARAYHLGLPCTQPCRTAASHTLIFDEAYYVNAARVIDGINPPVGSQYHDAPLGKDPNAEHPQLAKLVIAGSIELLGNDPWGWRLGSIVFGLIALVAMYALVRAAGGGAWLAIGATAVMALDNLMLVHGRIGTLDIYAVAMMLVAGTLYLRGSPVMAALALGIGGDMKLVALYLLLALALLEAGWMAQTLRAGGGWRRALVSHGGRLATCVVVTCVTFLGLLWLLDVLVPAYDPGTGITYGGNPFAHLSHMYQYAELLKAVPNTTGISSTPWQWLLDQRAIDYVRVAVNTMSHGAVVSSRPLVLFQGAISPFIILLAIPALAAACVAAWREADTVALVGVTWCLGTYLPFVAESVISGRITYLYYMLIVMPGVYLVVARLFADRRMPRAATFGWAVALVYSFLNLYPIKTLSGH